MIASIREQLKKEIQQLWLNVNADSDSAINQAIEEERKIKNLVCILNLIEKYPYEMSEVILLMIDTMSQLLSSIPKDPVLLENFDTSQVDVLKERIELLIVKLNNGNND